MRQYFLAASENDAFIKIAIFLVMAIFWAIGKIVSALNNRKKTGPIVLPPRPEPPPTVGAPRRSQPSPVRQQQPMPSRPVPARIDPRMQAPPRKKPRQSVPPPIAPAMTPVPEVYRTASEHALTTTPPALSAGKFRGGDRLRLEMNRVSLRQQLVMSEILGKPLALRDPSS